MGLDRKRKSINALQSTDKKRKSITEKKPASSSSSSEDSDEQSDHDNGLNNEVKNENPTISRWPQDDIQKLLSKMELALPKNDNQTFRSRFTKLDWDKIQFDSYSKDECQSTWLAIQDQLRTFKTIGDLIHDARNLLETKGIDTYRSKTNRLQKPRTAYMLFYTELLQKYKKKHPDLKLPQLTQIIAEKYNKLSPEKKQTLLDRAQKLKTEYIELVDKTNVGFKFKESNKPKTPFQIFMESKSSDLELGSVDKAEFQNQLKEKWDGMTEKKKSKWIKLANEREQTYLNNLKEDHKNDPAFTMPTKSALTKGDRNILDSQSGKPKKPPVNNYGLFSKEMLQSNALDGVPPKERMSMLAKKWKAFSNEERQIYSDKLKVITERYKTEFEAYLNTLPENEKQLEMAKIKGKPKKPEPKVVPRINAREVISEKPTEKIKKKGTSQYNSKTKTFKNEPKAVPYKNAFELYRSKLEPNEKHPITSLEDWNKKNGKKQLMYENELKALKKEYMKNLKVFLRGLSEADLQLYLQLRKPEFLTENNDSSASDDEENSSSEDDDDDDEDDNDNDDDDDDDDDSE
ncbi:nucleolar transcription factor 1-A-like [Rhopalosiphum maidis]|uniref:nucleolar transcription factor 1-A-like n=1 Tax=Rhopalosiphum maidis TaxID=43146 RepID=UPI000EFF214A|nr:nucleolar transcription factor 1-A-like [Rhopalosiphum maidis]